MLVAVSPVENNKSRSDEMVRGFSDDSFLESIDFDDLFEGMDDMLPDMDQMDPELFASDSWELINNNNKLVEEDFTSTKQVVNKRSDKQESSNKSKTSSQAKRKVKVDWTPELHRRFVQAVEQLGVDKAVPSRILEIMGIACLTRHNIASHLQKYRSHRKHVLAREAEAASWSQRRQMYGATKTVGVNTNGDHGKRHMGPWPPLTMGFPPPMTPYRPPLHVWGHPSSVDRPLMPPVWPKHIRSPHDHVWSPSSTSPQPITWHQRAPYFPQILPQTTRFSTPAHVPVVPGFPPTTPSTAQCKPAALDLHPSKESIDAAIGDILSQPWQPLPLGLKPPAVDSVMVELHRQGIQKIPPTCI